MPDQTGQEGVTSMAESPESLWIATTPTTDYDALDGGLTVDTAVIGGGITGLMTALELTERGHEVAVVEADRIVESTTGHTTAKLTSQHGLVYDYLVSEFGYDRARQYAEANDAAVEKVERIVDEAGIDCDFERSAAYTYAGSEKKVEKLRDEVDAATELGLPASFTRDVPLPVDAAAAVRFDDQAEFHPRKFLLAVAERVVGDGNYVFEETRATDVSPGRRPRVTTERGDVVADQVVVASKFPAYDPAGYFARMHPKRAYLLAVRIAGTPPEGMFYSVGSPPATVRSAPANGADDEEGEEELVLVGGQSHTPSLGGPETSERYRRCERFAREVFDVESVEYRWSTHDYEPVDRVPYIGKLGPGTRNVYVATGFKGWGMTHGVASSEILADLITEGESPWADVYNPLRMRPAASAKRFFEENSIVGARFVGDRMRSHLREETLPAAGEGRVVREGGKPAGVFRDDDGDLHAVSAVCPHMGCLVDWNDAERTWDCPCHGSRFDFDGSVLEGPAKDGLSDLDLGE